MGAVLLVAGGVLLALVALLAAPVDLAFRLERAAPLAGEVTVRWLLGLVRVRVPIPAAPKAPGRAGGEAQGERPAEVETRPEGGTEAARRRARREARRRPGRIVDVLRQEAFRERAWRLGRDLARAVRVRRLRLWLRLGLDDPADTGLLWAVMGPLGAVALGLRGAEVRIEPEFAEAAREFQAEGRILIVPLQVLALAAAFALSPPSMRAWRTLWGSHG